MRYPTLISPAVLAGAFALGCGDRQPPTAPVADPAPSLSVDRATGPFFAIGLGTERYTVILAATSENWAAFCATGVQTWDEWNLLTVTRPDGSLKQTFKGEDQQHVLVWENPADICAASPDFTGTARVIVTDSDVNLDGAGADATGLVATGTVTDGTGQRYHLVVAFHGTVPVEFTSTDNYVLDQHVEKIQLTPIGR